MGIFAEYAPVYWAHNLPVIPLRYQNKMPDITQWSQYGSQMPSQLEQNHWMASFPNGNIGLPLGPASKVCIIDIDTEDDALIEAILESLPKSPWKRVGKKGMALAYRFEGQRNFKLRGADGGMILEFLGLGNQVVLPPSIHPDTRQPYVANTNLWDVLEDLPELGDDIEDKLRALLGAKGFELGAGGRSSPIDVIPAGERDIQMVRHAGYLARVVLGIDKSTSFSLSDALDQMYHWVEGFTAKVAGDQMDPQKGMAKLLEFLLKDLEKGRTMPEGWDANLSEERRAHPTIQKLIELNTAARWDVPRARQWLQGKVNEKPDDDGWIIEKIWELIDAVAKDEHFEERDFRVLIPTISLLAGKDMALKKSDLLKAWKDAKAEGVGNLDSHAKIAQVVIEEMEKLGEIRFDGGQFWQWNGSCFEVLDSQTIYKHIVDHVGEVTLARTHNGYVQIIQVMERLCNVPLIGLEEHGLNFANGFVGEDLVVVDHDPKYGATFTLPFIYNRDQASRCNRWLEFLHSCWGMEPDFQDRVAALQEMFATTLFRIAPRYQRAFLLYGKAGTGKTQVLNVLRAMLPPEAVADIGPDQWGERFTLADLVGKAANICGELPENGNISGAVFKQVVEGSPCRTEMKYTNGFVFAPESAHWFASNYLPQSRDSTRGFIRRWLILDFNFPVAKEDRIENLSEILVAEEREAIAAWALEGLRRVLDNRSYTEPACHVQRMDQVRRLNNSVFAFLEDSRGVAQGEGHITVQALYDEYSFHVRDKDRRSPVTLERFRQMLEDLDYNVVKIADPIGNFDYCVEGLIKT